MISKETSGPVGASSGVINGAMVWWEKADLINPKEIKLYFWEHPEKGNEYPVGGGWRQLLIGGLTLRVNNYNLTTMYTMI